MFLMQKARNNRAGSKRTRGTGGIVKKRAGFPDLIGLSDLLYPNTGYKPYPTGKIVVIGGSQAKENVLLAIGQSLGISKDRFEMYLDYDAAKTFNFKKCSTCPPTV